jgi:hypothetical protein
VVAVASLKALPYRWWRQDAIFRATSLEAPPPHSTVLYKGLHTRRDETVSAARRFYIVFCEVRPFKLSVKMSAEAQISNFDTERFIAEVHSKIARWNMTTEAYSNRYFKKKKSWEERVDIFKNKEATAAEITKKKNVIFKLSIFKTVLHSINK